MTAPYIIAQAQATLADPHECTDAADVMTVLGALFDTLVCKGPDGRWLPALATSWQVSADARIFDFRLRTGIAFHNGDAMDGAAVRYSLERMARPDMGATLGAPGVYAQYLAGATVEALDAHWVRVTFAEPFADFLDILAQGHIVSPRAIETAGEDLSARMIGTGPYRLTNWQADRFIEVEAVPGHFDGAPAKRSLRWQQVADASTRASMLSQGTVHAATRLQTKEVQVLAGRTDLTFVETLDPIAIVFLFNAARGPMRDPRIRRALNLAIDRSALVTRVLAKQGQPLHGFVSPVHDGAPPRDQAAANMPYDPVRARTLLVEAGYGAGLTIKVDRPDRLPDEAAVLTEEVVRQLAVIGVIADVHVDADRVRYANRVRLKQIGDLCLFDSSPMSTFRVLHEKIDARPQGPWWQGYCNPEVETLIDQARRTEDDEVRRELYRTCYLHLQADPPWLYLYNHRRITGFADHPLRQPFNLNGVLDVRALHD
jgi:peptide/nickel transport system substrate-binding protein